MVFGKFIRRDRTERKYTIRFTIYFAHFNDQKEQQQV